jgi:Tol biopolymer transport system component
MRLPGKTMMMSKQKHYQSYLTRGMSISPDGGQIVFERQTSGAWTDADPPTDLWMMNRDGSVDGNGGVTSGVGPSSLQPEFKRREQE